MGVKFYRILVLYTLGDDVREEFFEQIKKEFPKMESLKDQSTIAIPCCDMKAVNKLKTICKSLKITEKNGHSVRVYYAAALAGISKPKAKCDCIMEENILESINER